MVLQTDRPIRLLYLLPSMGTGGTERLVVDCATQLDPTRFQVSIGTFEDGDMRAELEAKGRRVHLLRENLQAKGRAGRILGTRNRIRRLAKHIDILHTHHLPMLLYAAIAWMPRQGWRWVHTEHARPDIDHVYPPWLLMAGRVLLRWPDALTAVSEAGRDYFLQNVPGAHARCHTIYNAVAVDRFTRSYERSAKRKELHIPENAWVIGSVGNLRPEKNHALLIKAFAQLLPEVPEAWLVLVGGGELRESLERLAAELRINDRVRFLGSRLDVPELLAAFDAYCLPSQYEGMPISVFEAMAAGLPIIATNVMGIREVIQHGRTGLLAPPDNLPALAQTLLHLRKVPDFSAYIASKGQQYVKMNGRLETMLARYACLYKSLLKLA